MAPSPNLPGPAASPVQVTQTRVRRPTLGLLAYGAGDPNNYAFWSGAASMARERDVNLICFPGRPLRSPLGFEAQANVLYDLVDTERLDGLIIWVAGLTRWVQPDEFKAFCMRYAPLPIVTAGGLVEGIPGVIVDNYHGMRDVIAHLVGVHHHTRIAFIRGPELHQEAEERYRAYRDVLAEAGLRFDPALVVVGDFYESGGVQAVEVLLNQRHAHFDALAADSDDMAIGAMKALQARGIRIPDDLAIVGLNDNAQSRVVMPPLTTGPLHFYEQARQATEMVLALVAGQTVPERVVLPTRLLIRQSCGCPDPLIEQAGAVAGESCASGLAAARPLILAELFQVADASAQDLDSGWARQLLDACIAGITQDSASTFLSTLTELLRKSASAEDTVSKWHAVISVLRRHLRPLLRESDGRLLSAENLWQQARVLIGEAAQRSRAYQAMQAERQAQTVGEINQMLSATIDMRDLSDILAQALPKLGLATFCLSLYENPAAPAEWSRVVIAANARVSVDSCNSWERFPSRRLAAAALMLSPDNCYSLVVEPLYFREDQLGFVLIEADPVQENLLDILRGEVSGALKRTIVAAHNVELHAEAVQARQVAEEGRRLAEEADRLKSRFLAMVSHELRTPLSLIVGTVEMMQMARALGGSALPDLDRDMGYIIASAQHLARLIGDVLDLTSSHAGELRLTCEPLNLEETFQKVILLGESLAHEKGLTWCAEVDQPLPTVWADRTRLRQVVLNLVSNAVKFTAPGGQVSLKVIARPGSVQVEICDTGIGIPAGEQAAIFDEFRQSERTAQRGYGGIGLGLAISRRLVELHGGQIGVRSSGVEGFGSTFYFTLPAFESAPVNTETTAVRARSVALLTEGPAGGRGLCAYLQQRGFDVQIIAINEDPNWLKHVVAAPPGAVALDFRPAAEAGWELMRVLKNNPDTQDIPVVFYSLADDEKSGAILDLDYLTKPVRGVDLAWALERQGIGQIAGKEGQRILIVDDEPGLLDLQARLVEAHVPGCAVLKASNGREALSLMEREPPDLVLLDLMMPVLDGFGVLEAMREKPTIRDVPVIVLTARILMQQDMARLQQGVAAVLGKELFSGAEVLALVEATLTRNRRLGSKIQWVVRQAMAYIHEHYAETLTRATLAGHVAITERYLTRCFHEELGLSPMTYLNRYRVRQAKALLEKGAANITEAALAVGL